jgi:hypothetical protein
VYYEFQYNDAQQNINQYIKLLNVKLCIITHLIKLVLIITALSSCDSLIIEKIWLEFLVVGVGMLANIRE